ncbi:DNA/RNA-binding protein kin17 [Cladochytrium tenue]|nr:DNA/RNA-binding protein kin17 [Cladochytrium tenue]
MGKGEGFLTPKAIANRIKAKGLQKLRCGFLRILSRSHGTKRVHCNVVYQEYISDKSHVHMNATRWNSLSEFCRQLAREGLVEVDETEKGVFVTWIDSSPESLARQEAILKKQRLEKSDEERNQKLLAEQIEKAQASAVVEEKEFSELKRDNTEEPLKMKLELKVDPKTITFGKAAMMAPAVSKKPSWASASLGPTAKPIGSASTSSSLASSSVIMASKAAPVVPAGPALVKKSALEEIMEQTKRKREGNAQVPGPFGLKRGRH